MRIFTGSRERASSYHSGGAETASLRKSEMMSDLFNNQPTVKGQTPNIKLRLSNMAKRLASELKEEVGAFLKENKPIAAQLESLALPEEVQGKKEDLAIRKLGLYFQWMKMGKGGLEDDPPPETLNPYLSIHSAGKDEEIAALFEQTDQKRRLYRQEMVKNAPNYYYQAYPETYSFN